MKISETVGIDVSKLVVDVRIHKSQCFSQFENSAKGFKKLHGWSLKNSEFPPDEILFVFEHTGLYSHNLAVYFSEHKVSFIMVPGLEIKRSLGITRGKDDRVDATKIARYAYRLRDEIEPYVLPSKQLLDIKSLLSLRDRMVRQRAGYKTSFEEQKRVYKSSGNPVLFKTQESLIKQLSKQIDAIDKEMIDIVCSNDQLKLLYKLITSIKSVGQQTALFMIAYTDGFTKFKDSRKFAAYCGIAPFPNTSGTSVRGKTKVSHLANKKIKSLFDLCAKNAIVHNPEMKKYYNKRVEQGKHKMCVINIIRNKLLSRIFAVVNRKTPYVDLLTYST
jgi:transposase